MRSLVINQTSGDTLLLKKSVDLQWYSLFIVRKQWPGGFRNTLFSRSTMHSVQPNVFRFAQSVPNWQGIVHVLHKDCEYQWQSTIPFLPIGDMYPGDKTCILSTLQYICNASIASKHNAPPVVTFGQMLFWKASQIKYEVPDTSPVRDVVLFRELSWPSWIYSELVNGSGLWDHMWW